MNRFRWGALLVMAFVGQGIGAPRPALGPVDPMLLAYARPDHLAKLNDGRTIHIHCVGTGAPTVILTAGAGDWLTSWRKVQPQIANHSRVCSWDRAGFGFSSGSSEPQNVLNTTSDLQAALVSAGIKGPYVLVGHSLGSYESLLFRDRAPESVIGMVLVDPSIPDQDRRFRKIAPSAMSFFDQADAEETAHLRACAADLKSGKMKRGLPDPQGCLSYPSDYPVAMSSALARLDLDPARWAATISYRENQKRDTRLVVKAERAYGDMPLIVLSAMKAPAFPAETPRVVRDQFPALAAEFVRGHAELAALSSRGSNRLVNDSTHYIQIDRPDLVVAAVNEIIAQTKGKQR